jgi:hypothetical protein
MLPRDNDGQNLANASAHVYSELCAEPLAFWPLFTKFVSSCPVCCAKSHKDRAVIVPMSLFLGSTVWSSLLILRISWHAAAAALNSWPSRLWSRNSSPPPSRSPHYTRLENQEFVRHDLFHYCPAFAGTKLTNPILRGKWKKLKAENDPSIHNKQPSVWEARRSLCL